MKVKLLENLVLGQEHGCTEGKIFEVVSKVQQKEDPQHILEVVITSDAGVPVVLQNHSGNNHFEVVPDEPAAVETAVAEEPPVDETPVAEPAVEEGQ